MTKTEIAIAGSALGIFGVLVPGLVNDMQKVANLSGEFVCYTDGKLTERHVEVRRIVSVRRAIQIDVIYTNGARASYYPQRGEACGFEEIRP